MRVVSEKVHGRSDLRSCRQPLDGEVGALIPGTRNSPVMSRSRDGETASLGIDETSCGHEWPPIASDLRETQTTMTLR